MQKIISLVIFTFLLIICSSRCSKPLHENEIDCEDCGGASFRFFTPTDTTGEYYYITGVRLLPLDKEEKDGKYNLFHTDTLRNQFTIWVNAEYIRIDSSELAHYVGDGQDPNPGEVINPVDDYDSAELSMNRDIVYRGHKIQAYENILRYDTFGDNSISFAYTVSPFAIHVIDLNIAEFDFERGCYDVYALWHTNLGEVLADTVTLLIDME